MDNSLKVFLLVFGATFVFVWGATTHRLFKQRERWAEVIVLGTFNGGAFAWIQASRGGISMSPTLFLLIGAVDVALMALIFAISERRWPKVRPMNGPGLFLSIALMLFVVEAAMKFASSAQ